MNRDWSAVAAAEPVRRHQSVPPRRDPSALANTAASAMRCGRGRTIYEEGSPSDCLYRIVSGAAARFRVKPSGQRRIVDLLLPQDVFGFGSDGRHRFTAEATAEGTVVARYSRAHIDRLAAADPRIERELKEATSAAAARLHELILILGHTTAEAKVGAFLVRIAKRLSGSPTDTIVLPFSREEIADYLALSVETVSRSLTLLRRRGAIRLTGSRRVQILDPAALADGSDDREVIDNVGISAIGNPRRS